MKYLLKHNEHAYEGIPLEDGLGMNARMRVKLSDNKVDLKKLSLLEVRCVDTSSDDAFIESHHYPVYPSIKSLGEQINADYALVSHDKYNAAHAAVVFFKKDKKKINK